MKMIRIIIQEDTGDKKYQNLEIIGEQVDEKTDKVLYTVLGHYEGNYFPSIYNEGGVAPPEFVREVSYLANMLRSWTGVFEFKER
jgi:hypothetical protein